MKFNLGGGTMSEQREQWIRGVEPEITDAGELFVLRKAWDAAETIERTHLLGPSPCGFPGHLFADVVWQEGVEHRFVKPSGASTGEEWVKHGYCSRCKELQAVREAVKALVDEFESTSWQKYRCDYGSPEMCHIDPSDYDDLKERIMVLRDLLIPAPPQGQREGEL